MIICCCHLKRLRPYTQPLASVPFFVGVRFPPQEISPADIPLLGLMSAVARVLGIANVFDSSDASRPAAENAGKTFYEKFLVPRLLASASSSPGDPSGTARVAMIPLKELVEMHLSATSGKGTRCMLSSLWLLPSFFCGRAMGCSFFSRGWCGRAAAARRVKV